MPTNTFQSGGVDLNWSTTGNWTAGWAPIAGEDVVIPNGLTAVVDVARIPATGSLNSLSASAAGTGALTINMATREVMIFVVGAVQGAAAGSFITLNNNTYKFTLTASSMVGGSAANAACLSRNGTNEVELNLDLLKGGDGSKAYGFANYNTGVITLNITDKTGGAGANAHGFYNAVNATVAINATNITGSDTVGGGSGVSNAAATGMTLGNCNLINDAVMAWDGNAPNTNDMNNLNYIQLNSVKYRKGRTVNGVLVI